MKYLVLIAIFSVAVSQRILLNRELDEYWEKYKEKFGKVYSNEREEAARRLSWEQKIVKITRHNLEADLGMRSFKIGLNTFSDLSHHEFRASKGCRVPSAIELQESAELWTPPENKPDPLPDHVDWRDKGYVTRVKDQHQCGSCWAFSTTGALEGQWMRKNGTLVALSEQQLIDCSKDNQGCNGGWIVAANEYIYRNQGIDTEASYPYRGNEGNCAFNNQTIGAWCWASRVLPSGNEETLKEAVALEGPVAVSFDGSQESFMDYNALSGIYDEPKCNGGDLNHAALVVGYGTEDKKDYWLVKNSYGEDWGIAGYIKMSRNKDDQCGIAREGSHHEFRASKGCRVPSAIELQESAELWTPPENKPDPLPDHVDWRDKGYVTRVKDQHQCGSCWAFSTTGALEGQWMRKNGTLVALSEQQLIDCSKDNQGCNGGWIVAANEYIYRNQGIDTEASYPYRGNEGNCAFNNQTIGAWCWASRVLPSGNEETLKEAVALEGPVAVSFDGSQESFMDYNALSGIYDEPKCNGGDLNHAALVVGYGTEDKKDYWLVKNSYGEDWGIAGYIKMSRNKDDQCGIAREGVYPMI